VSPRRKQSTKDLGAILSEAVPVVVAEEVQLPAGGPPPHPAVDQPAAPGAEAEVEAGKPEENHPVPEEREAEATVAPQESAPEAGGAMAEPALVAEAAVIPSATSDKPQVPSAEAEPALGSRPALRTGTVAEALEAEVAPVLWRKSTIPFREDQYAEIGHVLADFFLRSDVQLTIAEVVRLGLDKMIHALKEPELREGILQELYRQQRRESLGNENLKHSKSRGLGDYLAARGRLPG